MLGKPVRPRVRPVDGVGVSSALLQTAELGVNAYCTYVVTPAQSTSSVTVSVAGQVSAGSDWRLTVGQQPIWNPRTAEVQSRTWPGRS